MIHHVPVTGGTLVAEVTGEGPTLVFLHGFSLDRRMWHPQIAAFSALYRCLSYDLRGFGQSSLPEGDYDHVDDLLAVLNALTEGPVVLVGLSLGANVALGFAAHHPERLSRLVLASSGLMGHDWGTEERPPSAADRIARSEGVEAARQFWLDHALFQPLQEVPEARALVERQVRDYSGWHWQEPGRGAKIAATGPLERIETETLVISGDRDVKGYRTIAGLIATQLPNARLQRLAQGGHMCNFDAAEAFNQTLAAWLTDRAAP